MIRGLPGSGKSTLARQLSEMFIEIGDHVYNFEADGYFETLSGYQFDATKLREAHKYCQDNCKCALSLEHDAVVIVSNTSTTESEVAVYQKIAEETGAEFTSIIVENRHNGVSLHDVPEETLEKMKKRFSVKL